MGKCKDLVGKVFGRLTVVERAGNDKWRYVYWLCKCECGNEKVVRGASLTSGGTSSCGCLHREITVACNTTHGLSGNSWYQKAQQIKARITNPKNPGYKNYGGRGLKLYEPWHEVAVFAADLLEMFGEYPKKSAGLSIDRVDNDRGYFPDNIRLADKTTQALNQRPRKNASSKYRGICWDTASQKWWARVKYQKKQHYLGIYETQEQAARARDNFILKNNWPHPLNFPKRYPKTLDTDQEKNINLDSNNNKELK